MHLALDHLISNALRRWIDDVARYMVRPPRALVLATSPLAATPPAGDGTGGESLPPAAGRLTSLESTLTWLRHHGLHDVGISLPGGEQVAREYLGDGSAFGLRLRYLCADAPAVEALDGFGEPGSLVVVNEANGAKDLEGDAQAGLDLRSLLLFHYQNVARDAATGATFALIHDGQRACGS